MRPQTKLAVSGISADTPVLGNDWARLSKIANDIHMCKSARALFRIWKNFLVERFCIDLFVVFRIDRNEEQDVLEAFAGLSTAKTRVTDQKDLVLQLWHKAQRLSENKMVKIGRDVFSFGIFEGEAEWLWISSLLPEDGCVDFVHQLFMQKHEALHKIDSAQALLYKDELSGLYNYRYLRVALLSETRRADRLKTVFSLLFIDVDDLKKTNDKFGHLFGSFVLRQCGQLLKDELRDIDTVIRYGGDEFIVILLGVDPYQATAVAERIRQRVANYPFKLGEHESQITVSIGISSYPQDGRQIDDLVQLADKAMFASKRSGKNQVQVIGPRA